MSLISDTMGVSKKRSADELGTATAAAADLSDAPQPKVHKANSTVTAPFRGAAGAAAAAEPKQEVPEDKGSEKAASSKPAQNIVKLKAARGAAASGAASRGAAGRAAPARDSAARGAAATRGGAAAAAGGAATHDKGMFGTLMISDTKPFRPARPSIDDIMTGRAGNVGTHMEKLYPYVRWRFSVFLYKDEVVRLRQPLYASVCPDVNNIHKNGAASGTGWRPTSVMEPLDMERCIWSLNHSEFYEGNISIWNLDPMKACAFGIDLDLRDPSWLQFDVLTRF